MELIKVSDDEFKVINEALARKVKKRCAHCDGIQLNVLGYSPIPVRTTQAGMRDVAGHLVPGVAVACTNCGATTTYTLEHLGVPDTAPGG